jgi:hypothetical protein
MLQKTEKRIKFLTQMTQVWTVIYLIIFARSFSMERRIAASPRSMRARSQPDPDRGADRPLAHAVIEGLRLCVGRYAEETRQQLARGAHGYQFSTPFRNADTHSPIDIIKRSVASSAREASSRQASI